MGIVEEEADETIFWMELLVDSGTVDINVLRPLMAEANEIVAMTVVSIKTTRYRTKKEN